jgi:hypothetical protein
MLLGLPSPRLKENAPLPVLAPKGSELAPNAVAVTLVGSLAGKSQYAISPGTPLLGPTAWRPLEEYPPFMRPLVRYMWEHRPPFNPSQFAARRRAAPAALRLSQ